MPEAVTPLPECCGEGLVVELLTVLLSSITVGRAVGAFPEPQADNANVVMIKPIKYTFFILVLLSVRLAVFCNHTIL